MKTQANRATPGLARRKHPAADRAVGSRRQALIAALLSAVVPGRGKAASRIESTTTWPTRALRLIVGYAAGSSPDVQARLLASRLSTVLGQPVTVENKPGAGGNIGAGLIAKATDGHTIGIVGNGPLTTSPLLYSKLPYVATTDFAPVSLLGTSPLAWVDSGKRPVTTLARFMVQLRSTGNELAYGSVGIGSGGHLGMELIKERYQLRLLHVPFPGGPAIINAILGEQIDMALLPLSTALPLLRTGRLRAIALCTSKRSSVAPLVPALAELVSEGEAIDIDIEVWNGIVAPSTFEPKALVKLKTAFAGVLGQAALRQEFEQQGWSIRDTSATALSRRIAADTLLYRDLIARMGLRIE